MSDLELKLQGGEVDFVAFAVTYFYLKAWGEHDEAALIMDGVNEAFRSGAISLDVPEILRQKLRDAMGVPACILMK